MAELIGDEGEVAASSATTRPAAPASTARRLRQPASRSTYPKDPDRAPCSTAAATRLEVDRDRQVDHLQANPNLKGTLRRQRGLRHRHRQRGVEEMKRSSKVVDHRRPALSHIAKPRRFGRDEPRSGLFGRLCHPRYRQPGSSGHGLTFTIGRGNEICCMAIKAMRHLVVGAELAGFVSRDPGALLAASDRRQPAALDRPRQGRDPPRHRRGRQRHLGSAGPSRRQAGLAARRRHVARRDRRYRRLPLPHRRAHARRSARHPAKRRKPARPSASPC
jgi:hypothetical protein